jgi:hypothetical protein
MQIWANVFLFFTDVGMKGLITANKWLINEKWEDSQKIGVDCIYPKILQIGWLIDGWVGKKQSSNKKAQSGNIAS